MNNIADRRHIGKDEIELYLEFICGESSYGTPGNERDFFEIEEHLAECDFCAKKVNLIYDQFLDLKKFNINLDEEILLGKKINTAIKKILQTETDPPTIEKLNSWIENTHKIPKGVLKVWMNMKKCGKRRFSKMITEVSGFLKKPGVSWEFEFLTDTLLTRSGEEATKAINIKRVRVSSLSEKENVDITINNEEKLLVINISGFEEKSLPITLLVPEKENEESRIGKPFFDCEGKIFKVIFKDLPDGEYTLLFGPQEK